jgi:hypothetical protein
VLRTAQHLVYVGPGVGHTHTVPIAPCRETTSVTMFIGIVNTGLPVTVMVCVYIDPRASGTLFEVQCDPMLIPTGGLPCKSARNSSFCCMVIQGNDVRANECKLWHVNLALTEYVSDGHGIHDV